MRFKNKCFWAFVLLTLCISTGFGFEYNISVPEEVVAGKWFSVNSTVSSETPVNFTVYSYVYDGNNCVGQGWIDNRKQVSLDAGEEKLIVLEDLVKFGTEQGWYNLRVRYKFGSDNITETFNVRVMEETAKFSLKETYLYAVLIAVCIIGVYLAFKHNR